MTKSAIEHPNETSKDFRGRYAAVNGLNLYYEIHGTGIPLILLHGGVGASEMFGLLLTKLAENRQVISVHLQAHGKTADIDRPLSFELMADDIDALINISTSKKLISWATRLAEALPCRLLSGTWKRSVSS